MKRFKTFLKLQLRMISKSKSRFFSVLIITFIGTAFFSGIRVTPFAMYQATDTYLDNQQYADLTLIPTFGADQGDIDAIKKIDGIGKVEGIYYYDALLTYKDEQDGFSVYSLSDYFDKPYVVEGKLPTKDDQCLMDQVYFKDHGLKIGDKVHIKNDQGEKDFEIVGVCKDIRYIIYYQRGQSNFGNGTCEGFILTTKSGAKPLALNENLVELLDNDRFYNELLIEVKDANKLDTFKQEYRDYIKDIKLDIEDLMESRLETKYQNIIQDKNDILKEPLAEYEKGLKDYLKGKQEFEIAMKEAEIGILEGKMQIIEGKKTMLGYQDDMMSEVDIQNEINTIQNDINDLKQDLEELQEAISNSQTPELPDLEPPEDIDIGDIELPDIELPEIEIPTISDQEVKDDINAIISRINSSLTNLSHSLTNLGELADGLLQFEAGKIALDKAELELELGANTLEVKRKEGQEQLDKAKEKLDEAKIQLDEAQEQIDAIKKPTYYLLDQGMNEGLANFQADADRIGVIGEMFPLMFFLVAALVSLTTMTRMVEEQRGQSGTLRALGYSRYIVMAQYLVYATLATLIGALLGIFFGNFVLPYIILTLYEMMMYDVPIACPYVFDLKICIEAILIAVVITLVATAASCVKELINVPAVLMRPKPPKLGKRILLERIPLIWKNLSFNQKVTMRNIFRYKKRFLMSLIGIAGCTGLIVTGYGIKYSVKEMTVKQFGDLWLYDGQVGFEESFSVDQQEDNRNLLKAYKEIDEVLMTHYEIGTGKGAKDETLAVNIIVPGNMNRYDRYLRLLDYKHKKQVDLNDESVIITEKLAEMLDLKVGDTIFYTKDNQTYEMQIGQIVKQYIQHYIYMTPTLYERIFNQELQLNMAYFKTNQMNHEIEDKLGKSLMNHDEISSVSFNLSTLEHFDKQFNSLDLVVWILIGSAGALAFVVLYNLTNININERIAEIATIKVLGFRKKETYDYIFNENIVLSILGAIVGLGFGTFLHHYIMTTVEVDLVMFVREVKPISYLYAVIITLGFTFIINRYMRRTLDDVDMVSSLKSVE